MKPNVLLTALIVLSSLVAIGCSAPADEPASTPVAEGQGTGKFKATADASGSSPAPTGNDAQTSSFRSK